MDANKQRGNTYDIKFQYKEDGVAKTLPAGYDMVVGLYNKKGEVICHGSILDGNVVNSNNMYYMHIDHETSMLMSGKVSMEITIRTPDNSFVEHGSDIPTFDVDDRKNNELIKTT